MLRNVRNMISVLTDVYTGETMLKSGILRFKKGIDQFYEYMCILASHKVSPLIVSPLDLRNIHMDMRNSIC